MIRLSVSALALCAGLSPAFATTVPEAADLLENCFGGPCDVSVGSREETGDGDILLSDVNFVLQGEDSEAITLVADEITLTETEDGVVAFPGEVMRIIGADGSDITITHQDLIGVITKAVGSDVIAVVATTLTLEKSGEEGEESKAVLDQPVFTIATDEDVATSVEMTADEITIEGTTIREEGGSGKLVFKKPEFTAEASAELIRAIADEAPDAYADGIFSASFTEATGIIESPTGPVDIAFGPFSTTGEISNGIISYGLSAESVSSAAAVPDLGPINFSMDRMNMTIEMPVGKGGGAFSSTYDVAGLAMDDQTWALLDNEGNLPHDPGSLSIDVSGTMTQDAEGELGVSDMKVEKFDLSLLGARGEATGNATFDPTTGAPSIGEAYVTLTGVNSLISTLGEAGLLPAEIIMQARAMLGVFAVPKAGAGDVLTSEIRMGEGGSITVNGVAME